MANYEEYPKEMHHPQARPAEHKMEPREGLPKGMEPGTYDAKPAFLPPVTVHTRVQEEQAAAKGYVPNGESDPEAYRRGTLGITEPVQHVHREFPKWKYHAVEEPVLVETAEDEAALGASWADLPSGPFPEDGDAQEDDAVPTPPVRAKRNRKAQAQA